MSTIGDKFNDLLSDSERRLIRLQQLANSYGGEYWRYILIIVGLLLLFALMAWT